MLKKMLLTLVVLSALSLALSAETVNLKVLNGNTPIRETPSSAGKVLYVAAEGTLLKGDDAQNGWYRVLLPEPTATGTKIGYIFENKVESLAVHTAAPVRTQAPPVYERTHQSPVAGQVEPDFHRHFLSMGAGVGIPYGVIGVNFELFPAIPTAEFLGDYFGITMGVGYAIYGASFNGGIRFYPFKNDTAIRPRFTFCVGTVGYYESMYYDDSWDHSMIYGGTIGAGCDIDLSNHLSIDADAMFILFLFGWNTSDLYGGQFKVSGGLRWNF